MCCSIRPARVQITAQGGTNCYQHRDASGASLSAPAPATPRMRTGGGQTSIQPSTIFKVFGDSGENGSVNRTRWYRSHAMMVARDAHRMAIAQLL